MVCGRTFLKCEHTCKQKCHGESPCNEYLCDQKILWYCKCGNNSRTVICGNYKKEKENFEKEHPNELYVIPLGATY